MHDVILDKAKAVTGSDRQTAMRIGLQAQFLYAVRAGQKTLPSECIIKLAFIIEEPWPRLLAEMEGAQAKDLKKKDLWLRAATGALSLSIALLLASPEITTHLANNPNGYTSNPDSAYVSSDYLLCEVQ